VGRHGLRRCGRDRSGLDRRGDTFAINSGGAHYLFTFSPTGVESFGWTIATLLPC
jgi:hypothetical protein